MSERCSIHGEVRNVHKILVQYLKGRNYVGDLDVDRRIRLKWALHMVLVC